MKRPRKRASSVAVIDIGSNSVRLVVYEAMERSLVSIFNEKTLCGLGREVQSTGLLAPVAVAKALVAAGKRGSIINLSSQAMRGAVRGVHYSASKGGVVSMTRAMALELAPHNIRVNAIAPGTTDTAQPRYGNTDAELIEMARATIPLGGKLLAPDQIARSAVFLASDDADAITGQVIHVNGGAYMAS